MIHEQTGFASFHQLMVSGTEAATHMGDLLHWLHTGPT